MLDEITERNTMLRILLLTSMMVLGYTEEVWVGLRVGDYDQKGKYEIDYYAGQIATDDIKRIKEGGTPDGFIEVKNVLYIDTDDDTYEMNADGKFSKEESNTFLVKIRLINQIIYLKDDPRKIFKLKDKTADVEKVPSVPQKESPKNW